MAKALDRGARIRAARERCGWTQAELASRVKRTSQTIHRWETGKTGLSSADLIALCDALGESPRHLEHGG